MIKQTETFESVRYPCNGSGMSWCQEEAVLALPHSPMQNTILAALPAEDCAGPVPDLELTSTPLGCAVCEFGGPIKVLDRAKLEERVCECDAVVKKEYDRLLPYEIRGVQTTTPWHGGQG